MAKRKASDRSAASSDREFEERQRAHARESERGARLIDELKDGRARDLLKRMFSRLEVTWVLTEEAGFNDRVLDAYVEGGFWRAADVVAHLQSEKGAYVVVRSRDGGGREHREESDTAPLPPHATPPRARAQNMCFMTIEGIDRMNVLERDVCSILDLGEFSTTRFVRSAGGKAPVMIDMQLRAGEAASGQMPTARDVEHLEANLEMSVVVGAASVVAMGAKVRARARSCLLRRDENRSETAPPRARAGGPPPGGDPAQDAARWPPQAHHPVGAGGAQDRGRDGAREPNRGGQSARDR